MKSSLALFLQKEMSHIWSEKTNREGKKVFIVATKTLSKSCSVF